MKILYPFALLLILFSCVGTQTIESEEFENKSFDLDEFTSITVYEGIEVVLHESADHRAEAESNFIEYVRLKVDEGNLTIDMDQPSSTQLKKNKTKVEVWAKNVNRFNAASSGKITVDGKFDDDEQRIFASSSGEIIYNVDCEDLLIEVSSSGAYTGDIKVDQLNAGATSSGEINLRGSADDAKLSASSSGDIKARKLNVDNVEAEASSSGDIEIGVKKELKGKVSSGGSIGYKANGDIKIDIDKSSGGDVKELKGIL